MSRVWYHRFRAVIYVLNALVCYPLALFGNPGPANYFWGRLTAEMELLEAALKDDPPYPPKSPPGPSSPPDRPA